MKAYKHCADEERICDICGKAILPNSLYYRIKGKDCCSASCALKAQGTTTEWTD